MDNDIARIAAGRSPKSEIGLIAMAAWCNVRVDQLPEEARSNPNDYTVEAWARVANHLKGSDNGTV
jgi:hypothetical protein